MLGTTTATPCPPPLHPPHQLHSAVHRPNHSLHVATLDEGDSTANINFTSALHLNAAGLGNAKPRRPGVKKGKFAGEMGFAICEDVAGEEGQDGGIIKGNGMGMTASTVGKRPQRPLRIAEFAPRSSSAVSAASALAGSLAAQEHHASRNPGLAPPRKTAITGGAARRLSQAPRRPVDKIAAIDRDAREVIHSLPSLNEEPTSTDTLIFPTMDATTILKPARRRTIYIPNEDTTMPSMYMGLFSPIKDLDAAKLASSSSALAAPFASISTETASGVEPILEISGIAAQIVAKRQRAAARKSTLGTSPKRLPLQSSTRHVQGSAVVEHRWGQGGGKENVPPGQVDGVATKLKPAKRLSVIGERSFRVDPLRRQLQQQASAEARVSQLFAPTASSMGRISDKKTVLRASTKPTWNAGARLKTSESVCSRHDPVVLKSSIAQTPAAGPEMGKPPIPSRFVVPRVKTPSLNEVYPILTEDLPDLSMYEDNWLHHQEIAITQLVNNLFEASNPTQDPVAGSVLRIRLLQIYGSPESVILYKRLQAALLYGALSVPSELLRTAARLNSDLGRRKTFTDFWLETYDLRALQSALEVVVGRQCLKSSKSSTSSRSSLDGGNGSSRQDLQTFIEAFLIRNEDGSLGDSSVDHVAGSYQRTLLRSLLLINLLDGAKSARTGPIACLFQPNSQYKSSTSVVKGLFQLLNPSAGDPVRALNHIGYTVGHTQFPLEEYSYKMENLAVDLRDGVCLTRLVELLLYPSASGSLDRIPDADATKTVVLPTGAVLVMTERERDWPLSQHLHFPCHGRATKLYNAQIALSAMQGVKGMTNLVQDIQAEDIVDGYREKTVRLLWGLTSKWGLGGLIDWNDVEREIKRLCRLGDLDSANDFYDLSDDDEGYGRYRMLLKSWAQAIANQHGIAVKNLTTSFADGRVFEAIVDQYQAYLTSSQQETTGRSLGEKLSGLGCSEQFVKLFSTSQGSPCRTQLFDRDFVLAALAFLCSRLLGPSMSVRAVVSIQRVWRAHWSRVVASRKVQLKAVAKGCSQRARDWEVEIKEGRHLHDHSSSGRCGGGLGSKMGGFPSPGRQGEPTWKTLVTSG